MKKLLAILAFTSFVSAGVVLGLLVAMFGARYPQEVSWYMDAPSILYLGLSVALVLFGWIFHRTADRVV